MVQLSLAQYHKQLTTDDKNAFLGNQMHYLLEKEESGAKKKKKQKKKKKKKQKDRERERERERKRER